MYADKLRKSVLQAAIQGQLTEQLPSDGDARDLLKKIRAEKSKLVKTKKIKETILPPISDDELPFQIPANWCWARLGEICNYGVNSTISQKNMVQGKFLLDLEDIEKDTGRIIRKKFFDGHNTKSSKFIFKKGDVLFSKLRVYLNKVIIADEDGYCTSEILPLDFGKNIFNRYAQIVLMSPMFVRYAVQNSYGTKMPRLGTKSGILALFPLPPLAEQERIVAKLDEVLAEIELLAADERALDELEKNFPRKMKNSLLHAAIQGQLTEQLPSDGDARDLLKKIRAEKSKLVKAKKIKDNPLPPISDDELPFQIPANWCWARLGDICEMYTGNSISETEKKEKYFGRADGLDFIATKDISFDNSVAYDNGVKIPQENKFKLAKKNSVLMCIEGGSAGRKIALIDRDVCFGNKLCNFNAYKFLPQYLYFYLQSPIFRKIFSNGIVGIIGGVGINKLRYILIPLPPLAEQERIVAKLDELLVLC